MLQPGDILDLDIIDVAHGGVFVARHEGRVVFVSDAIPGERVRARLTQTGDRPFWRADTVDVLQASPRRQQHVWAAADVDVPPERRPGGADFGHIRLAHQRELKQRVLGDALRRIGGLDLPATVDPPDGVHPDDDGTRWRTRVRLHVDDDGRIGPYAARSHTVVAVEDLPLARAGIARAARGLQAGRANHIDLVEPFDGRVRVVRHARPARGARRHTSRARAAGREVVTEQVGQRVFAVDAAGFWQVHHAAASTLARVVGDAVAGLVDPSAVHLDLYGGVGLFAAVLGDAGARRLVSVESDARATAHARDNLEGFPDARAETARVDRWLATFAGGPDARRARGGVVVLDPPRSGAGADVVRRVAALAPAAIVYVACDPVALARDVKTFRTAGYEACAVTGIDLFPHSHHLEAVAVLTHSAR